MGKNEGGKKNTKSFRMPVNKGVQSDTFAEDVPLQDINNMVLTPNGTGIQPRPGFEIRRKDIIGFDSNRKTIYFISDPPDIDDGDLIVIVNNKNGDMRVELTEVVKSAGVSSGAPTFVASQFWVQGGGPSSIIPAFALGDPYTEGAVQINREPVESGTSTCRVWSQDIGDAVAGVDYTAFDQILTFTEGETEKVVAFPTNPAGQPTGKSFRVRIGSFSLGSGCPNDFDRYNQGEVKLQD